MGDHETLGFREGDWVLCPEREEAGPGRIVRVFLRRDGTPAEVPFRVEFANYTLHLTADELVRIPSGSAE